MKISIDTKEDSHEDIRRVIKMLRNLIGDAQEVFTNEPAVASEPAASPLANIFGDVPATQQAESPTSTDQETQSEKSESTEDLFAELFSEEELKKMSDAEAKEDKDVKDEITAKPKDKKHKLEFY